MKHIALTLALLAAGASAASAADSPFSGTWKLNVEKSTLAGQTLTYTASATGFEFSNGSTVKFDFAIDGKDYPVIPGRTVSWTKARTTLGTVFIRTARGRAGAKSTFHRRQNNDRGLDGLSPGRDNVRGDRRKGTHLRRSRSSRYVERGER